MPRKSAAALSSVCIDVARPTYLEIPDNMPSSVRDIVQDLVESQRAGHFKRGDEALLEAFAAAHLLNREAFQRITKEGAIGDGKPSAWLGVLEKSGKALVALSGRLRLCPQMRSSARSLGRVQSSLDHYGNWQRDE